MRWLAAALLAMTVVGCGSEELDRHVEDLLTIDHGIYGQITAQDDIAPVHPSYGTGYIFDVYAKPAGTMLGPSIARPTGGERGFYELALDPGNYVACAGPETCIQFTAGTGLLRFDLAAGYPRLWSGGTAWP